MITLYPTDTVYGLAVDATDAAAVEALKALKGRGEDKHISIAVSDVTMMRQYADVTPLAEKLIAKFLPGKLTLILNMRGLPSALSDDGTIGVRIPNHPAALALIAEIGRPITATSANVSGMPTLSTPAEILNQFGEKAALITRVVDAGVLPPSAPSTVVDARGTEPIIIREGAISKKEIYESVG